MQAGGLYERSSRFLFLVKQEILLFEIFRLERLHEGFEFFEFGGTVGALTVDKRIACPIEHRIFYVKRGILAQCKRNSVARPSVKLDKAVMVPQHKAREEHRTSHVRDKYVVNARVQIGKGVKHQIMRHRPCKLCILKRDTKLSRFSDAHPYRNNARADMVVCFCWLL